MQSQEEAKRILVIDEDPGLRMVVQSELQRAGYTVDTLNGIADATPRMSREHYDLIIVDASQADRSDVDVLPVIRLRNSAAKVIVMAALEAIPTAIRAVRHGADDFVPKPFDTEYLLRTIRTVLREKKA